MKSTQLILGKGASFKRLNTVVNVLREQMGKYTVRKVGSVKRSKALRDKGGKYTLAKVRRELDRGNPKPFFSVVALMPSLLNEPDFYQPTVGTWAPQLHVSEEARTNMERVLRAIKTKGAGRPEDQDQEGGSAKQRADQRSKAKRRLITNFEKYQQPPCSFTRQQAYRQTRGAFRDTTRIEDCQRDKILQAFRQYVGL